MFRLSATFLGLIYFSNSIQAAAIPIASGSHWYTGRNNNLEWKDCSRSNRPGRECTRVEVPLDWHDDAAGKASLFVARYPATNQPKLGTVFINPGGQVSDYVMRYLRLLSTQKSGYSGADAVLGGGDIFMQQTGGFYDIVRNFTSQNDLDDFYAQVGQVDDYLQRFGKQCLATNADALKHVGTAATVRDMVAIHDILEGPDKPVNFWGLSYGTVLGIYFVNMFPNRVGRVVLDAVVDPKDWANRPAHKLSTVVGNAVLATDETFDGFAKECVKAGAPRCAIAGQNATVASIRQWTYGLINAAYDYRRKIGPLSVLTSSTIRAILFVRLYDPQDWGNMAQDMLNLKTALDDPNHTNLTETVLKWVGTVAGNAAGFQDIKIEPRQEPDSNQTTPIVNYAFDAISCSDAQDSDDTTTKEVFDYVVNVTRHVSPMFGPVGIPRLSRVRCHRWPVRAAERYAGPWNKKLSNPILTIGNEADPATPYINAKNVADALGSSAVFLKRAGYGHSSLSMSSNCRFQLFLYLCRSLTSSDSTISILQRYFVHNELPEQGKFCETSTQLFDAAVTG
ncbi:TAP-like protein [Rhizoctonia solani]|uniref:TAP-like protein n=1 Tax=Rhizoctonia solani TaxID=456999 RepID=A0A8H7LZS0_9AGAM|nr:TAP-like protein [Rhizoctonia solani]